MRRAFLMLAFLAAPAQAQDGAAGERVFRACRVCHQVGETARQGVGPNLNGILGRRVASVAGFNYSAALRASPLAAGAWSEDDCAPICAAHARSSRARAWPSRACAATARSPT